jgi:1-acyl-sn-glycerol-3-phosphate acyltransferase
MASAIINAGFWYQIGWRALRAHLKFWNGLTTTGLENVPLTSGGIVASNHISHLDPPAVGTSIPKKVRFVAKEELFHQFFLSWYLPLAGVIPIKRGTSGQQMLDEAARAIEQGDLVIMFPEGTRSKTGLPGRPRTGVLVLASRTGAPVIPARISGSYDCMPPGSLFPRPGKIQVSFGKPIVWPQGSLDLNNRESLQREAQRLMETIIALPGWTPKRPRSVTPRDKSEAEDD